MRKIKTEKVIIKVRDFPSEKNIAQNKKVKKPRNRKSGDEK